MLDIISFLALASSSSLVHALPAPIPIEAPPSAASRQLLPPDGPGFKLDRRAPGDSAAEPIIKNVSCTGAEAVCNADCYAILCLGAPNPVQYGGPGQSGQRRQDSGAEANVYTNTEVNRQAAGVFIPDAVLNQTGRSPEEAIMASSIQGGAGELLINVDPTQNSLLGSQFNLGAGGDNIAAGQWYKKVFNDCVVPPPQTNYCDLLQNSYPPDTSQCSPENKDWVDPSRRFIMRSSDTSGPMIKYHMMNFDAGDRWLGPSHSNWPASPSKAKRDEVDGVDGVKAVAA